jgi:hypothetical protein
MIGEIYIDPDDVWATGQLEAEVTVHVYLTGDGGSKSLEGASVEIYSSRNTGEEISDIIEQPTEPTDNDGMAVAYLGSYCPGESYITAAADGAFLCKGWEVNRCTPLRQSIVFYFDCNAGDEMCCDSEKGECGCYCTDVNSDPQNCGDCNYVCEPGEYCLDGVCQT